MRFTFAVLFGFIAFIKVHEALRFPLEPGKHKCVKHDSPARVITNGQFEISEHPSHTVNIVIKDTKDHLLYQRDNISKGNFAFTTEDFDLFEVCFSSNIVSADHAAPREIFLDIKQGAETKNFELAGNAEKLKPMEIELKRLEALTDEVVRDFNAMHAKSSKMRSTNESTHSRVLYFSVLSMLILVGFACWQVLYLRRYFKSKKLIE